MQMTKAQAVAELERIQELLPLIAEAVKEERKPVNRYAKTSYFKEAYGQSMGTVKNRKYGIMNQIKLGRYPKDAIIDRYIDKAVYADYNRLLVRAPFRKSRQITVNIYQPSIFGGWYFFTHF